VIIMKSKRVGPGALAGAGRAAVKMPVSKDDVETSTPNPLNLQLHRLLSRYAISADLALVIAEHAFLAGRTR
jgi:hypothetical protein